jgi:uncharacterized protein
MIKNSFIFLPKVTPLKERKIWQQGVHSWDDFLKERKVHGIPELSKPGYNNLIEEAKTHLYKENSEFFTNKMPSSEQWRLYNYFKDDACFLDIETTGYHGDITVLGLYDGKDTKTFVKGQTLYKEAIQKELEKYKLFITFNGASFDIPVIKKQFNIPFTVPHMDLRFAAKKIGLSGGLKNVEKEVGIKRADEVEGISGADAVYLWQKYKSTGNKEFLDLLVQYNEEDIVNLQQLADYVVPKLWEKTRNCD